jgi:hypothetical protein
MANAGGTPGDGKSSPFGNGMGGSATPEVDTVPGALKGATVGESHESEGGKWVGLGDSSANGEAGNKSSFRPGSAT